MDEKQQSRPTTADESTLAQMQPDTAKLPEAYDEEKAAAGPPDAKDLPPWHPMNNPDGGRQAWLCVIGGFCCM